MGGSSTITTGYTYFGSYAQVVCAGPVDVLHEIRNGGTVIWTGPVYRRTAMDGDGRTVLATTIGAIRFYWGVMTQRQDPLLASVVINQGGGAVTAPMPGWAGVAYAVCEDVAFGTQTTPPTLIWSVSRFPAVLPLTGRVTRVAVTAGGGGYSSPPAVGFTGGGGSGAAATAALTGRVVTGITMHNTGTGYTSAPAVSITGGGGSGAAATAFLFHEIDGDAIIPEVIYDWLTNTFYGCGLAPSEFNLNELVAACETVIAEGMGASPWADSVSSARDFIGKLLPYVDAVPRFLAGQIGLVLVRNEPVAGVPSLTGDDYTDELEPSNRGLGDTWNVTRIVFTDRDNDHEEGVESYDHTANAAIAGQTVDRQFNFPFVTRRETAKRIARRVGIKGGRPPVVFRARLLPEWETLAPGARVFVTSEKLGINARLCRVHERQLGGPRDPGVEVTMMAEQTRDESHDYQPPVDQFLTPAFLDVPGAGLASPRLLSLPPLLAILHNEPTDGFLAAFERPDGMASSYRVWFTHSPTAQSYRQIMSGRAFPMHGTLLAWGVSAPNRAILRVRMDAANAGLMVVRGAEEFGLIGMTGWRLLADATNQHQVAGLWFSRFAGGYFAQPAANTFDIEVTHGRFGSAPIRLQRGATPANNPTEAVYFGRESDFAIFRSEEMNFASPGGNAAGDTDQKRRVKVTTHDDLEGATEVYLDRNDLTMSPGGTYSHEWGVRALPLAEYADRLIGQIADGGMPATAADLDIAFGAVYQGAATAGQLALIATIDTMLGLMVETNSVTYTDTP